MFEGLDRDAKAQAVEDGHQADDEREIGKGP